MRELFSMRPLWRWWLFLLANWLIMIEGDRHNRFAWWLLGACNAWKCEER